jgi:predicted secreted protein
LAALFVVSVVAPNAHAATTLRTYHLRDSGATIAVDNGETFRISLRTATDGGYSWAVTKHPDPKVLDLLHKTVVPLPHPGGGVGFPSRTSYTYRGVGVGRTSVTIVERQSFAPGSTIKRFRLTIDVLPRGGIATYHLRDSGGTVIIGRADDFRLSLRTDSDGGYSWIVTKHVDPAVLDLLRRRVVDPPNTGVVGATAHTYYTYEAVGAGQTSVTITERRSFDHSDIARTFHLTVIVR